MNEITNNEERLFNNPCGIIDDIRGRNEPHVNTGGYLTNWFVGKRIKEDIIDNQRAYYDKQVLKNVSKQLVNKYHTDWGNEKLKHCLRSAYLFIEDEILYAMRTKLNWTHLYILMGMSDILARQFYLGMAKIERWSTRTLEDKIDKQLYEETAISRRSEEVTKQNVQKDRETHTIVSDKVLRISYFWDILGFLNLFSEEELDTVVLLSG